MGIENLLLRSNNLISSTDLYNNRRTVREQRKQILLRSRVRYIYIDLDLSNHDFINQGLFATVQSSMSFQKCATTDLSTCLLCGSICKRMSIPSGSGKQKSVDTCLELRHVPVLDLSIRRVIRPRKVYPLDCPNKPSLATSISPHHHHRHNKRRRTMMKQRPGLVPLVRPELPRLARRHHAHHPLPCVRTEFLEGVCAVYDKVSLDGALC